MLSVLLPLLGVIAVNILAPRYGVDSRRDERNW